MYTRQSRYAQIRSKLEKGLEKLKQIAADDSDGIGAALIKIHGAMEDFVRFEIAEKAPHLRETVEDRKTSWRDLLDHGSTYLKFSDRDRAIISEANAQRNAYAHGWEFTYNHSDLINYAQFVRGWLQRSDISTPQVEWRKEPVVEPRPFPQPTLQPAHRDEPATPPTPPVRDRHRPYTAYHRPWYRSTLFLFVTFFLFPPLWAILMLTDRNQGCLLRSFAALLMALEVSICALVILPLSGNYSQAVQELWQQLNAAPGPTRAVATVPAEAPPSFSASPLPVKPESVTSGSPQCSIVWVEGSAEKLAGKNRSMVWLEVVQDKVRGSGMTSTQFYQFVVDHNPQLVKDGYEFKKGKTYYLPECQ